MPDMTDNPLAAPESEAPRAAADKPRPDERKTFRGTFAINIETVPAIYVNVVIDEKTRDAILDRFMERANQGDSTVWDEIGRSLVPALAGRRLG